MSNEQEYSQVLAAFASPDRHVHGSGALLDAVCRYMDTGLPDVAYALAKSGSSIMQHNDPFDFESKDWTDIYLEAFRRAFFDKATAPDFGCEHIANNPSMLKMVSVELITEALSIKAVDVMDPNDLPANVTMFPAVRTRQ